MEKAVQYFAGLNLDLPSLSVAGDERVGNLQSSAGDLVADLAVGCVFGQ